MSEIRSRSAGASAPVKAPGALARALTQVTPADALGALTLIVTAARESIELHERESTAREKLKTYRDTELERIRASERVLRDYFDRVFEERKETHRRLFASLDTAISAGDAAAVQAVVGGIVEVARTSPLANLGNLAELRAAMDDPDTVFEF